MGNGAARIARKRMERYPHAIARMDIAPDMASDEIRKWCQENHVGPYLITWTEIRFAREEDAVLFRMVWL